jgi:hypothetical protein
VGQARARAEALRVPETGEERDALGAWGPPSVERGGGQGARERAEEGSDRARGTLRGVDEKGGRPCLPRGGARAGRGGEARLRPAARPRGAGARVLTRGREDEVASRAVLPFAVLIRGAAYGGQALSGAAEGEARGRGGPGRPGDSGGLSRGREGEGRAFREAVRQGRADAQRLHEAGYAQPGLIAMDCPAPRARVLEEGLRGDRAEGLGVQAPRLGLGRDPTPGAATSGSPDPGQGVGEVEVWARWR